MCGPLRTALLCIDVQCDFMPGWVRGNGMGTVGGDLYGMDIYDIMEFMAWWSVRTWQSYVWILRMQQYALGVHGAGFEQEHWTAGQVGS